jgi:hypothetical protein
MQLHWSSGECVLQRPTYYIANDESANNVVFHVIDYPFHPVYDVEIDK